MHCQILLSCMTPSLEYLKMLCRSRWARRRLSCQREIPYIASKSARHNLM